MKWVLTRTNKPPTGWSRIGGPAVGVRTWPMFRRKPMEHVLTLDVRGLELDIPEKVVGVSLFVGSTRENQASTPQNRETTVLFLDADDLGRGEVARPGPTLAKAELAETGMAVQRHDAKHRRILNAFAGGDPGWLQEPEGPSRGFILQFDQTFVPMDLGDSGVMYVFADCAWW